MVMCRREREHLKNSLMYGLVSVLIIIVLLTAFSSINVTAEDSAVTFMLEKDVSKTMIIIKTLTKLYTDELFKCSLSLRHITICGTENLKFPEKSSIT